MAVVKLNRAIKYRAYPTEGQAVLLAKTFGCVRFVWNHMLTDAQTFLDEAGVFFIPTPAKYKKEFPFLKEVDSLALANTQLDLKDANKRHLESPKTVGVPRLKSKHKSGMSVASGMEAMGLSVETGYYDPDDESSVDVPKQLIGFHYVVLKKNA